MFFKSNNEILEGILKQLNQKTGNKHDVHHEHGKGALFVISGQPLHVNNVVLSIDEMQLHMIKVSGGNININ